MSSSSVEKHTHKKEESLLSFLGVGSQYDIIQIDFKEEEEEDPERM